MVISAVNMYFFVDVGFMNYHFQYYLFLLGILLKIQIAKITNRLDLEFHRMSDFFECQMHSLPM